MKLQDSCLYQNIRNWVHTKIQHEKKRQSNHVKVWNKLTDKWKSWDTHNLLLVCLVWWGQWGITVPSKHVIVSSTALGGFHEQRIRVERQGYIAWPFNHKHSLLTQDRMNHFLCYPYEHKHACLHNTPTHTHTAERDGGAFSWYSNYISVCMCFLYNTKAKCPAPSHFVSTGNLNIRESESLEQPVLLAKTKDWHQQSRGHVPEELLQISVVTL